MDKGSQRYVLVKFLARDPLCTDSIEQAVQQSIEEMVGQLGSAEMRMQMIGFDEGVCKAVFRCSSGSIEKLRAVLAVMTHVNGNPTAAMVLRSSGTIKGLRTPIRRRRKYHARSISAVANGASK